MAMDFRTAGDRVRSLVAAKKPGQLSRSALTKDDLRDNIIRDAAAHTPRFQSATKNVPTVDYTVKREDGSEETKNFEWTSFDEAVKDTARGAFSFEEPTLRPTQQIRPSHQFNREVLDSLFASEDFQAARPYTRNNEAESLFSTMRFAHTLREMAPEVAEHVARSEEMREAEEQIDSADQMFENLRKRARQELSEQGEVQPGTKREIKKALKQGEQARGSLGQLVEDHLASNHVQAATQVADAAGEAIKQGAQMLANLPGVEAGNARNMPLEQQLELAEKWGANPDLAKVLEMLGRMVLSFKFKRQARTKNVKIEPVSITTGRDLELLLPHEYARATVPQLQPLFVRDYHERKLLQYEMSGKAPQGKGPIIEIHDGSGSMAGEKFVWATSLGMTLAIGANREKREFAGIEFGSGGELKSWVFPAKDPLDPDRLLDFATHFFGGGTSTLGGFREALRIMREFPQFESADIILIGDGQDRYSSADEKVRDELRAMNVRIHGITIMTPRNPYFEQMCDWHIDVTDLAGANGGTDALAEQIT